MIERDVVVIGGGPAGLAAAIEAHRAGARVLLIEREAKLGGILKQCIHDGFGLLRYGERLSGPEYAGRDIDVFRQEGIEEMTLTFVTKIQRTEQGFLLSLVNREGITHVRAKALVLATGCRERTAKQVGIHGTRPSGVFTAGTAQHLINLKGQMVTGKCVILGSGDIGLIMARRLTLEGAEVIGVYEAKDTPSGLERNVQQCLVDFNIPLHLSRTVTRVFGRDRLTGVEICEVDKQMNPIPGTEERIACDALILSVGLIPENELAESLGVAINPATGGPFCDQNLMTSVEGVFSCGNALHVNDLVDYVSESGVRAGRAAARFSAGVHAPCPGDDAGEVVLQPGTGVAYVVPQKVNLREDGKTVLYFRSKEVLGECCLSIKAGEREVLQKKYMALRPPQMERLEVDFGAYALKKGTSVRIEIA